MNTQVILPVDTIKTGGSLNSIALELMVFGDVTKASSNGDRIYSASNQELFETILTHDNIMLIVNEGGNILNYIMYAAVPYQIEGTSIYNTEVPEGLQNRAMQVTDGTQIIEAVKNLGQWCNASLSQTFSEDFKTIYVTTSPLGDWLTGEELKIFVDGFDAQLLTRTEYYLLTVI